MKNHPECWRKWQKANPEKVAEGRKKFRQKCTDTYLRQWVKHEALIPLYRKLVQMKRLIRNHKELVS